MNAKYIPAQYREEQKRDTMTAFRLEKFMLVIIIIPDICGTNSEMQQGGIVRTQLAAF